MATTLLVLLLVLIQTLEARRYAVIIDAGSSGSRVRIFSWKNSLGLPQEVKEIHSFKTSPGISDYVHDLPDLKGHVKSLVDEAIEAVPSDKHSITPLYLMATAGMRLILEDKARDVMSYLDKLLEDEQLNPFLFEIRNCRILSGEEEGAFMWIAANYLRGFFTHKVTEPVGILELGGASMQIAFQTTGPLLADKFPVLVGGELYELYVHSYLHYGQTFTRKWILDHIAHESPSNDILECPCLLKGDLVDHTLEDNRTVNFTGSGDAAACTRLLEEFVYEAEPEKCFPKPCAIGTVYQPSIPEAKRFFAVSAFVYTAKVLGVVGERGQIKLDEVVKAAQVYCSKHIDTVHRETGIKKRFLSSYCLIGNYMPVLFTDGFGFPRDADNIYVKEEISDISAEWALGALIYENELLPWCNAASTVVLNGRLLFLTLGLFSIFSEAFYKH